MAEAREIEMLDRAYACTSEGLSAAMSDMKGLAASRKALVILDEIATNIVRESGATTMRVAYRRGDGESLVFADDGVAFDPLSAAVPVPGADPEVRQHGGVGIRIVKTWAKGLRYRRHDGHNELSVWL